MAPTTKRLFIAEKPSAGKDLAAFLAKSTGAKAIAQRTHVVVGNDTVAWLRGHVLEAVEPHEYDPKYEKWNYRDLPILPDPFRLKPVAATKDLLANVKDLLKSHDLVVNFGDPDQEGQLLVDEALEYVKNRKPVHRLWVSALDDTSLSRAMGAIKSNADYRGYYESALSRSHADWLYGINMTRALTVCARRKGAGFLISIGRVQTPTLALVVNREREIRNFKPLDYFIPWLAADTKPAFRARWKGKDGDLRVDPEGRLLDKTLAGGIVAAVRKAGRATVTGYDTVKGAESAPLPFSLSALQAHASRLYGFGASQVLELAQSLYEKKLASYPRVDTDYLPESQFGDAARILASLAKAPLPTAFAHALAGAKTSRKSRAWNDKKVTAHHAIIPTHLDSPGAIASLTDAEKKIYFEIVRRYVLQFWPSAEFLATTITLDAAGETFTAKGKRYTDEGWRKAMAARESDEGDEKDKDDEAQLLPVLKRGDVLRVTDTGMDSLTTKPPKRFTEGTLISAMKNIHQYVKDPKVRERLKEGAGIGTEATRSNIIETLFKRDFIVRKGKELAPTENGERVIDVLPASMSSPDMTALWQSFMDSILKNGTGYEDFLAKQRAWITQMVAAAEHFFDNVDFGPGRAGDGKSRAEVIETDEKCDACGSNLKHINGKYGWFWACSSEACKKIFSDENGKPVERKPRAAAAAPDSGIRCPLCQKASLRLVPRKDGSGHFWGCAGYRDGCRAAYSDQDGKPVFKPLPRSSSTSAHSASRER